MTEIRQASAERSYVEYLKNQQFEEMTDIGERLGYFNEVTLHYDMKFDEATGQNAAYCLSDTKNRAFHDQTLQAMEAGKWKFTDNNAFEALRLQHEHDEALTVDAFGRGELDCNVFIKVSKVPDAVVNNTATVDGYRRDLMRSFVRIYYRTGPDALSCLIFSLDGNSHQGFSNTESLVGMPLANRQSEDVLAGDARFDWDSEDLAGQIELLKEKIILEYDRGMNQETGKNTYAGSQFTDLPNALEAVRGHQDLFEEHWRAINDVAVRVLAAEDRADFLEDMRRRTAAAIKLRTTGVSVGSIGDADVANEAETGEYGRECATNGMNQTEQRLLDDWTAEVQNCPICGASRVIATKSGDTITGSCGCRKNICTGEVRRGKASSVSVASAAEQLGSVQSSQNRALSLSKIYGEKVKEVHRVGIGTAYHFVEDGETGEFVAWLPGSDQSSSIF